MRLFCKHYPDDSTLLELRGATFRASICLEEDPGEESFCYFIGKGGRFWERQLPPWVGAPLAWLVKKLAR